MSDFQYIARGLTGQQVDGVLSAGSEQEALAVLAGRSLFPMQLTLAPEKASQRRKRTRRVRPKHLAITYSQLADLLRAGVPLLRSLELLEHKTTHSGLRNVLAAVRGDVAEGTRLADAMRKHPKVFSELAVSMVRAGEEGAFVEDVLKRIADFTDHQEMLKSRVTGAMVYPMFLMGMGTVVVVAMLTFFVPKFTPIFERMSSKGSLPAATTWLLALSDMLQRYGIVVLLMIVGGVMYAMRWSRTDTGRLWFDRMRLRLFGIGPIFRSFAISRFCRILGTLLRNGVPILESLRIAKDATGNRVLSQAIAVAAENVSTGKALAAPLGKCGEFPTEIVEMIAVGEEANNLEQVLIDVADTLERQTNRTLDLFVRMLEPVMLTVLAGVVLFVVIALLLPILQSSTVF
ncbi:MAG TPA: type II secretion system F family protein [Planctomycetaceae bacterium]|jgi:general secretion pathway protein F/type IV pilus assembly protein PilC|nr:type II secretion system F family protein [Planctomycetaceae bacterium]